MQMNLNELFKYEYLQIGSSSNTQMFSLLSKSGKIYPMFTSIEKLNEI